MKSFEPNICYRLTASGETKYIVRIADIREPTGLWFNGTYKTLSLAREVRDEQLAKQEEDRKLNSFNSRKKKGSKAVS